MSEYRLERENRLMRHAIQRIANGEASPRAIAFDAISKLQEITWEIYQRGPSIEATDKQTPFPASNTTQPHDASQRASLRG